MTQVTSQALQKVGERNGRKGVFRQKQITCRDGADVTHV